ncbi:hypothetical protein BATDEDRAFT_18712, partial [Batrachochytrium dendrobatidis JAM81]
MIPTTNHLDNCNAAIPINTNHKRCAIVAVSPHTKLQSPLVRTSVLAPSIASVDSMSLPNALSFDKLSNRTSGIVVSDAISTTSDDPPFHKDISVINSSSTAQNSSAYTDHGLESCQIASMPETTVSIDSNPISTMLNDSTLVHAESLYTEQHVSSDATSLAVPSSILSTVPFEVHRTTITPKSDENTSTTLVNSHINNSYSRNHLIDQPFGTTGLQNLGNTCFMNSALQCLSNTVPLTHYFLFGSWKNEVNSNNPLGMNGRIPKVYANLIHQLWRDDQERPRSFSPREFKHTIGELNPTFQGYGQQDSHELLQSLLDGLHEDLNRIINKEYVEDPEMKDMSEDEFAKVSWNAYCKRNDSIIVDLFQAQLKNRTICQICSNVSVKFDPYMYLQVPIPEPKVVLLEIIALSYIFPEILDGDDTMYCSKCMEHRPIRKKLDIYSSPDILVIHLKRFANTGRGGARRTKLDCMVDAPLEGLDMSQVLACESLLDTDAHLYDLYAVSNHFGGLGGGHYTAFVKNPLNGKWYDCDDSSVSLLNSDRIVTEAAYLLFYTR